VLEPPPRPIWGWSNHPHGQGGGPATPKSPPKKKKKKNEEWVLAFWGWPDHPQGPGGGFGPPKGRYGVAEATPRPLGVVRPPPKAQNPFFVFFFFWGGGGGGGLLGVAGPPHWPWGPQTGRRGWPNPPPGPWGWSGHPQKAKTHSSFFFFVGFWGWPDHPLGHGGGSTTPRPAVGVAPATLWPKMGWPHPRFLPPPPFF
jgi:hypothetical protein